MTTTPWPIAIVGAGCASPAGFAWRGLSDALATSRVAASRGLASTHPHVLGCEVPEIPASVDVGDRKLHRLMSRGARLGAVAVRAAIDDAAITDEQRERAGFFMGVGASNSAPDELAAVLRAATIVRGDGADEPGAPLVWSERKMCEKGLKVFHPLRTFALMPNMTLCHTAIALGIRGPSAALFSRGAGTVTALVEAAWAIADGECDVAIAGAADTAHDCLTWSELGREAASARSLVPGEAGAALVLARGSERALAWITGAAVRRPIDRCAASELAVGRGDRPSWNASTGRIDDLRALTIELGESRAVVIADALEIDARALFGSDVAVVDASVLGQSLAASPALAWCVALDLIATHEVPSVTILGAGADGQLSAVRLAARDPRAVVPAVPFDGSGEIRLIAADGSRRRIRDSGPYVSPTVDGGASGPAAVAGPRRAVITGVGVVSAFGVGYRALLDGLAAGRRAIRPLTCFDASALGARVAGQVPVDRITPAWIEEHVPHELVDRARAWIERGALRDRKVAFALVAAAEAWRHAGLDVHRAAPSDDGLLALACGLEHAMIGDLAPALVDGKLDWSRELARGGSGAIRNRAAVDVATRAVTDMLRLGPHTTHVSACAAGALSVAHAAALVERGASMVVCGATDSMLDPIGVGGMVTLGTTSPRADDLDACRPFDRRRDGLVLGEGAAIFVVEDEGRALARGAVPLARILGWGASQDGYKPSAPEPDGAISAIAMRRAIERAGIAPSELGYINAHGTGTPLNDVAEVRAIRRALGDAASSVPISSIKGAVGHLMAASGSIELAASLLAFERDLLPGTANHRERDPDCDVDIIGEAPRVATIDTSMSSSFGFGGQNSVVVLGRCS